MLFSTWWGKIAALFVAIHVIGSGFSLLVGRVEGVKDSFSYLVWIYERANTPWLGVFMLALVALMLWMAKGEVVKAQKEGVQKSAAANSEIERRGVLANRPIVLLAKQYAATREARELEKIIQYHEHQHKRVKLEFDQKWIEGAHIGGSATGPGIPPATNPQFETLRIAAREPEIQYSSAHAHREECPRSRRITPTFRLQDNQKFMADWKRNFDEWHRWINELKRDFDNAEKAIEERDGRLAASLRDYEDEFGRV